MSRIRAAINNADGVAILLLAFLLALTSAAVAQRQRQSEGDESFSKANKLLFLSDHLADVEPPAVLHYRFEKRGSLETPFTDTIDMTVTAGDAADVKAVKFDYFTGVNNQYIPPLGSARGNPIISLFLQQDVNNLQSRTGGSARYFQNAIKLALEEEAKVKPVNFKYDGRLVEGTKISITPYLDDPHRKDMAEYANKHYTFVLSDSVPGEVYELGTRIPAKSGVLLEETLKLDGAEPLDKGSPRS
jgi:hypothetical protein